MRLHLALTAASLCATLAAETAHAGDLDALVASCAPLVHPITMSKLIRVESAGRYFAVSDDGPAGLPWSQRKKLIRSYNPKSYEEAVVVARRLRDTGHLFGLGLAQVSSRNLARFGLTLEQALDPCTNLRTGSEILTEFYLDASKKNPNPNLAVLQAISAYNTGNFVDGFNNGYVRKVVSANQVAVPALSNQYDSRLPTGRDSDPIAGSSTYPIRYVRPPELLSHKIIMLRATTE